MTPDFVERNKRKREAVEKDMSDEEIYHIWEGRMKQVLESSGMNIYSNSALVNSMFDCAKKYLLKTNR